MDTFRGHLTSVPVIHEEGWPFVLRGECGDNPGYGMMKPCGRRANDPCWLPLGERPLVPVRARRQGPERPIFGKVRCMSLESAGRKVRLRDHIRQRRAVTP